MDLLGIARNIDVIDPLRRDAVLFRDRQQLRSAVVDPRDPRGDSVRTRGGQHRRGRRRTGARPSRAFPKSTLARVGIVALVVAALGLGIGIGVSLASKSPSPSTSASKGTSNSKSHDATSTTTSSTTTTTAVSLPSVLSCGPSSTPHIRPARLTVGCATGAITVTGITWKVWGADTGGQGTGTLNVNNCQPNCALGASRSTQAVVIVFHPVSGIFQDVSVTPTQGISANPQPPSSTSSTTIPLTTTTTSPNAFAPVAASQPGSGWGGD